MKSRGSRSDGVSFAPFADLAVSPTAWSATSPSRLMLRISSDDATWYSWFLEGDIAGRREALDDHARTDQQPDGRGRPSRQPPLGEGERRRQLVAARNG